MCVGHVILLYKSAEMVEIDFEVLHNTATVQLAQRTSWWPARSCPSRTCACSAGPTRTHEARVVMSREADSERECDCWFEMLNLIEVKTR